MGKLKRPRRRISVICIDAAPNSQVANELAERGGGQAYFLTSSPDEEDITTALEGVLADWAEPVLTDLRLKIDRGGGLTAGRNVVTNKSETVIDVGDLPCGRAIWVAGRAPLGDDDTITFQVTNGKEAVFSQTISRDEALAAHRPALKALFGARRLTALEYLINARYQPATLRTRLKEMGYDADAELTKESVYAENALKEAQEALRPLLVRESLEYGIACAETAFIAVRQEAGEPIEGATIVANALPAGWDPGFRSAAGAGTRQDDGQIHARRRCHARCEHGLCRHVRGCAAALPGGWSASLATEAATNRRRGHRLLRRADVGSGPGGPDGLSPEGSTSCPGNPLSGCCAIRRADAQTARAGPRSQTPHLRGRSGVAARDHPPLRSDPGRRDAPAQPAASPRRCGQNRPQRSPGRVGCRSAALRGRAQGLTNQGATHLNRRKSNSSCSICLVIGLKVRCTSQD